MNTRLDLSRWRTFDPVSNENDNLIGGIIIDHVNPDEKFYSFLIRQGDMDSYDLRTRDGSRGYVIFPSSVDELYVMAEYHSSGHFFTNKHKTEDNLTILVFKSINAGGSA